MLLSIITLNYKKSDLTLACMASLFEQFYQLFEEGRMELIVVENASDDGSLEKIKDGIKKAAYKNVHVVVNKENAGFSKGCNVGAKFAKGDFLLFLNNDTLIKDQGILHMTTRMKNHSEVAILGGQMRNADGTLQPSTGKFYTPWNAMLLLFGMQRFGMLDSSPQKITEVNWVKGGLFMIKKEIFQKLGGFDEHIFMYTEDMELCYRAKKAGYKTFFYPDIMVFHKEHGSASRSFAIVNIYKNLLYFYKKHLSANDYQFLKLLMKTKATVLVLFGKIIGKTALVTTYEQALKVI